MTSRHRNLAGGGHFLLVILLVVASACGGRDTEAQLQGPWKNGDGNLLRFAGGDKAFIGQEGLSGEGECRYEVIGDSVRVRTLPGDDASVNTYFLHLAGDTLYLDAISLERPGQRQRIAGEELARRTGKPAYKLHFTRIAEDTP
ncbi:MAG: hypothetical protein RRA94_13105 [Bacteroidota bacterium]|nr:hypothetical protein [Bacteroidota bacterium]